MRRKYGRFPLWWLVLRLVWILAILGWLGHQAVREIGPWATALCMVVAIFIVTIQSIGEASR